MKYLTAHEVAERLSLTPKLVWTMAREGAIPSVRLGARYVRFEESALEAWLAARPSPTTIKD